MAKANTTRRKGTITTRLKDDWLTKKSQIKMEENYYVKFPMEDIHSGHFSGEVSIYKYYEYVVLNC